eukprot:gene5206-343_t
MELLEGALRCAVRQEAECQAEKNGYKTAVRPANLYTSETWAVKKAREKKMNGAEMRMLRWVCGVTRRDKIRNEMIRRTVKVAEISSKTQERRLNWSCDEKRGGICWRKNGGNGNSRTEKKRAT